MNKLIFLVSFFLLDLILSQTLLLNFLEKDLVNAHKESFENRIHNENYNYTFKKLASFKSQYEGNIYNITTNDLGFRDDKVRTLDRKKTYSIVIGDSFIEGVGLNYNDTIVAMLNNEMENEKFKFLNAGVASYSSYIYLKKIESVIDENKDLKIKNVIVFLDKSDVNDDENYLSEPKKFKNTKSKFINQRKNDFYKDLKELSFFRFFTKQTITGKSVKLITDQIESFFSNLKKRFIIAKELNKNFLDISDLEIRAIKSINSTQRITNFYKGETWNKKTKNNIYFAIKNLKKLKKFLDNKNVGLIVVLYPWPFEIHSKGIRERYLNFIVPLLEENDFNNIIIYDDFLKNNIYENIGKNYLYNDIHFNKNGNKIISQNLIRFLKK